MWPALLLLLGTFACASAPPEPSFQDQKYLRFGVDPKEEADAVIESQKARAYVLAQRLLGQHFTALGFADKGGRSSAVRILTVRGTVIALDSRPQSNVQPALSYALIAPPIQDTHDADGDGFEEIFVEERSQGKACLQLYRVRDVGSVDRVVVDTRMLGQELCPRTAIDLDGDGIVELQAELELSGFSRALPTRRLQLPLWADNHRYVARSGSAAQRAWLARERASREAELQRARAKLDVATAYSLGIELAALAYLDGRDRATQLAAFDLALRGLVLQPAQAVANLSARSRIYTDWNEPATTQQLAPLTAAAPSHTTPRPVRSATVVVPAGYDGPPLAEGDLVITPDGAAARAPKRRAAPTTTTTTTTTTTAPLATPDEVLAYRNRARELGNAAVAARARAAEARREVAAARSEAQAARLRAGQAADPAAAEDERKAVAEHVAAAQRHATEAAEFAAEAARLRTELDAHKATAPAALRQPEQSPSE